MEHTPPLPSGFNINGYLIQSLKQTDPLCHVYYVLDASHVPYLLREFCPQGLAVRDPESGKLRYPENTDIEREVLPLKNDFEAQFRTGSLWEIPALGTLYLAYAIPGSHAAAEQHPGAGIPPAEPLRRDQRPLSTPGTGAAAIHAGSLPQPRKKKNSAGLWLLTLLLLGGACGTYYYTQITSGKSGSLQEPAAPQPGREKKEAAKPEKKAVLPAVKAETSPEQKNAAPASPSGDAEQLEKTSPSISSGERNGDAPDILEEKSASSPAQTAGESGTPDHDAADGKQQEPENPANRKEAQGAQSAVTPVPETRLRGKTSRQTTNMGDVNAYVRKFAKPMTLNQWKKQYANLYTSWFGNSEEVAKGWITTFGPLGFRARGLDASWPDTNFRGFFPKTMLDPNGEPVANLYTVTQVIEGSPAEKYVKEGDLILGIDGHPFKTSQSLDVLYGPYQHQDRRGLDMHAGLLLDKAEGAGKITLNIIPAESVEKIQGIQPLWKEVLREERAQKPVSLSIPVKGGQQVRLRVDDGGNGIGSDGFEWSGLRLEGPGGTVPLTRALQYTVGYGEAKYAPKSSVWQAHAVSSLVFDIPKGDWELKGTGTPRWSASVGVTVQVGGSSTLPDAVKKYVKNVTFKTSQR